MVTITFNDEICDESYEKFEQKVNEALEKEQDLTIYICTNGGEFCLSQNMTDIINNYPYYVEVIFSGWVFSAGMYIMTNLDYNLVDVNLTEATEGMVHLVDMSLSMRGFKDKDSYSSFAKKNGNIINECYLKNIKRFLTEKEMKVVNSGKEVYLNHDRMAQIIETLTKEAEENLMRELAYE
jgi:hypothetical protein